MMTTNTRTDAELLASIDSRLTTLAMLHARSDVIASDLERWQISMEPIVVALEAYPYTTEPATREKMAGS